MSETKTLEVNAVRECDLVKELRLRRWARLNYVTAERRGKSWHPVVLHEMGLKDLEVQTSQQNHIPVSTFVPLPPTMLRFVHPAHDELARPKSLEQRVRRESFATTNER